ncbi:tRNA 2-selenouridine synthase [Sideroxyarcus emersonii]|uniref:tRNA 2-selenouridine synthase n=1 Tax=Sideroxyarcus emersonii TaxID=2764705 RepID=A0AAN2BZ73_9PROT|nr:tRNA 2-selenouridine(34) synthase MnmH [Sideroxyarcus emersonii]BCK87865.1 tRNA 2-selenouridine synthase [Sideroxyarcus emersonii]
MQNPRVVTVSQLSDYNEIVDVRSPAEYAEDHIPGAISAPVLDDEQRARVGTLYSQESPFAAKKLGAALIARNIAHHLDNLFSGKPKQWKPLVYCWRGGQRSGAMAHVLAQVGWSVGRLDGGYKSYRRQVLADLDSLPGKLHFRVVCGPTGSGKSRLLRVLQAQGAQVLDLEALAQHRGSLLGNLPNEPQPAQKMFESRIWDMLRRFDQNQPVFVEAESKKIGLLGMPEQLLQKMRSSECLLIEAPVAARVQLLMEDYAHFLNDPALLVKRLTPLLPLHGRQVLDHWQQLAEQGEWPSLVEKLLLQHYDPAYQRSTAHNFVQLDAARIVHLDRLDDASLRASISTAL